LVRAARTGTRCAPWSFVAIALLAPRSARPAAWVAVVLSGAYAALVSFNYIHAGGVVPGAVDDPAASAVVGAVTTANPRSICWAIELCDYGILGIASVLIVPVFRAGRHARWIAALLIVNGVSGVIGAGAGAVDLAPVMTIAGLVAYAAWNVAILALAVLAWRWLRTH
jgi:hypothetical protein